MGSEYPGAGCQVGAGLTFGYVAARHAAALRPVVADAANDASSRGDLDEPATRPSPARRSVVPIVGDPIAQVKSPDGITALFAERGVNAVVVPLQIAAADLDALITGLTPSASVAGLIATVPHKFGLAAHCATLTDRARFLGSANVARRNADGTWHGDQVDGAAFVAATAPASPEGRHARCRSARAGPGSAIALALLEAGVAQLRLHDADPARRDALVERLRERYGDRVRAGAPDPDGVRPRRQRHPDGHAGRRPLPGRRHAAEARRRSSATS